MNRRDAPRPVADTEIGARREDELGVDEQIAFLHVAVRIGEKLDLPVDGGVADLWIRLTAQSLDQTPHRGPPVQRLQLIAQRPHRLLLEDGDDAFEPCVLVGVEVDGVATGREGRVFQRLEVLAHVVDDGVDDVASRPARRCCFEVHSGEDILESRDTTS
jgi:hypothetical protein